MSDSKKEATKEINDILKEIDALYQKAAEIADKHNVFFSYSGPAGYGDGGFYDPNWESSDCWGEETGSNWQASSTSC